jgi:tetratricopeptide (TPR) repeat protein
MAKQPVNSNPVPAATLAPQPVVSRRLFTWTEWVVAALVFLVSGSAYFYFMSPEVTLQDSGELVTGAFHFGVPHPTGYPLWAFLGWVWRHLVPFGNPAWRICLFSVCTGAALCGILTLLMSRSILMLLRNSPWNDQLEESLKEWLSLTIAAAATLLFAFNRGVWQWACVPEMRVLNAFSFVLTTCIFFAWMMRPAQHRYLYALLLIWGLSLANHQTIIVMVAPFLIGLWVTGFLATDQTNKQRYSGLLEVGFGLLVAWTAGVFVNAWLLTGPDASVWEQKVKTVLLFGPLSHPLPVLALSGGSAAALLAFGLRAGMMSWKRAAWCAGLFVLGLSMYAYMPVAAATNPPMNWGYAATKQGFLHAITRGQYEQIHLSLPWTPKFWTQMALFVQQLLKQYSWPAGLFAVVPFVVLFRDWRQLKERSRQWLIYVLSAFLITWVGLIIIINPEIDKINQEINLKFFAPAHGFFAILIGYGLAMALAMVLVRRPAWKPGLRILCVLLLVLPVIPFVQNRTACDLRGHDFGYQFGYRMFFPGGDYPPMEKDAVLYGGTDPGRFVPTYMIFCESFATPRQRYRDPYCDPDGGPKFDRRDVYIITQNALADSTYLGYIRDHYDSSRPNPDNPVTVEKFAPWQRTWMRLAWRPLMRDVMFPREPIRIPTEKELSMAFQQYVNETRGRQLNPEEEVNIDPAGRVSVRGVGGVMAINGILTKWIFDWNKDKHAFYVEESYVIPWMYPYLTPHGNIMKINRDPVPTPQENPALWAMIVKRDKAYWDDLAKQFLARPEFRRDADAQRAFSKLRSAIGGIYANRRMIPEAEYAYQQARTLCPDSPEANFRLAQLYIEQGRFDDALAVVKSLQQLDPLNPKIQTAVNQMEDMRRARNNVQQFEAAWRADPNNFQRLEELAKTYAKLGQQQLIISACQSYISSTNRTPQELLQTAQILLSVGQFPHALAAVHAVTERFPQDPQGWYAAALMLGGTGQTDPALNALSNAIRLAPGLRDQARTDARFGGLVNHPRFKELVGLSGLPGMLR